MIKFDTSRFGVLEVEEDRVIDFPSGLVGFPHINRYVLIDHKDTPLKWLQALDDPEIAFIVVSPSLIVEEYSIDLDNTVRQHLQLENDDDLAVLVIMRANGEDIVANFQGPLLINASTKKGVQVVLDKPNK
jgi:flagellar assembly factor FliW